MRKLPKSANRFKTIKKLTKKPATGAGSLNSLNGASINSLQSRSSPRKVGGGLPREAPYRKLGRL